MKHPTPWLQSLTESRGSAHKKVRTSDCRKCLIMRSLRDAGVPGGTIQAVCERMWLLPARKRQILYLEDSGATHLFAVRSGKVKLLKVDRGGRIQVASILEAGDLFGFEAIFAETYGTGAETLTDCELCLASADDLNHLMEEVPGFAADMAHYLHIQLSRARERQLIVGSLGARAKVAGYLLHCLPDEKRSCRRSTVPHDLTLQDLGGILGISPETVCRILAELKNRGILETLPSGLLIKDLETLRRMAGN